MIDVGALAQPIMSLISGIGSGVLPAGGPSEMLRQASATLESAYGSGRDGLLTLESGWSGQTAVEALTVGSSVQTALGESADRGTSMAGVVDAAAADVRVGVGKLEEILQSFVSTVVAALPVLGTPVGQTMIVAAATEHLSRALVVVGELRASLADQVAALTVLAPGEVLGTVVPTLTSTVSPVVQSIVDEAGSTLSTALTTSPSVFDSGAYSGSYSGTDTGGYQSSNVGQYSSAASFTSSGGGPPSGPMPSGEVGDWIDEALEVLRSMGYDTSRIDPRQLALIIEHESAGNPHAINLWDSNAAAGTPSKGIMQTIDSTFHAYKAPGREDIWNPVDNIVAATRYAIDRYGSVGNVPGVAGVSSGGGYVGY